MNGMNGFGTQYGNAFSGGGTEALVAAITGTIEGLADLGSSAIASRQSLEGLIRKLTRLEGDYARETNPSKKAKLAAEIKTLRDQINRMQDALAQQGSTYSTTTYEAAPVAPSSAMDYLPWIIVGVLGLAALGGGVWYVTR